ncbi:MAG: hypothetical protein M0Z61_18215 [Nitrospiraceae bacterium]|nr:hypothetical protein [Nitrospiraceae bacterium]
MKRGRVFLTGFFFCLVCAVFFPQPSSANPEYARATGKQCIQCHGGNEVKSQRLSFRQLVVQEGLYRQLPAAGRVTRFLTGHIDLIAVTEWFGLILCVCLIWEVWAGNSSFSLLP